MDKCAIITGGGRGIGAATARLAAKYCYHVCVNYASDTTSAEHVAEECRQQGVRAIAVKADIAMPDAVDEMFALCCETLGTPDLLINNAGIVGSATTLENLDNNVLQRTFAVNVFGSVYCARSAVRHMSTANGGRGGVIINISSIAATTGSPGEYVHYAASKGAIETFTVGLAKEVGPLGIRVNCVQSGTADTDIHRIEGNPQRPAMIAKQAPLGRVASTDDIAEAALWLASEKASYASGAILRIGGGL